MYSYSVLYCNSLFVLQPFMGSSDSSNKISGKIKLGSETLFTIDGRWDQEIFLKDKTTGVSISSHSIYSKQ